MSLLSRRSLATAPRNLCDLFLRDLTALLVTSRAITHSLLALRPECGFSAEITRKIDELITASRAGEATLSHPLGEAGLVLPIGADTDAGAVVASFFTQLPAGATPAVLATEVVVNLRLLAQHLELKARLAAEEALLVGQKSLCRALLTWARAWHVCGQNLRAATVRARAQAYVADVGEIPVPQAT